MSQIKSTTPTSNHNPPHLGGFHLAWLLADDVRTIRTKDGIERTVVELRDPRRLSQSVVLWLDGPADSLASAVPGTLVQLHVDAVRPGRGRGELIGQVDRSAVEAALARAGGDAR
ncbi:hypothetical protein [Paraconexibacter algicola]|nr:hypothetical protein [Paraconexibacter algicola]